MNFKKQDDLWNAFSSRQNGNVSVSGIILGAIALAGLLVVGTTAPNALTLLHAIPTRKIRRSDPKTVDVTLKKLIDQKHILLVHREGKVFYELTPKGEVQLAKLKLAAGALVKPVHWDGKWRIVTYDIAEKRRAKRTLLLRALSEAGFYHLQDSVWVYPYPCRELELLLKFDFALGKEVLFIEGAEIELEPKLLHHFGLKRNP